MEPEAWMTEELDALRGEFLLRACRAVSRPSPARVRFEGRDYIDFASNDYLGLAADPRIARAASRFLEENGIGAGASPLITGFHPEHERLQSELADFMGSEAVTLFGSGHSANVGLLSALVGPGDIIFSHRRNHASLIDGCRLSKAKVVLFDSDKLDDLERGLIESSDRRRVLIVTDSVFSMEGDVAPLTELVRLADRHGAMLYLDEAHAMGVLGARGAGLAEELKLEKRIPFRLGTLSKSFGVVGGFLATRRWAADWIVNHCRGYIFSTAMPPVLAAAARESLRIIQAERWRAERAMRAAGELRQRLHSMGHQVMGVTTIVPLPIGDPRSTLEWADRLKSQGFWVGAIRPPSVAPGGSRLRIAVSAAHTSEDIDTLAGKICDFSNGPNSKTRQVSIPR